MEIGIGESDTCEVVHTFRKLIATTWN